MWQLILTMIWRTNRSVAPRGFSHFNRERILWSDTISWHLWSFPVSVGVWKRVVIRGSIWYSYLMKKTNKKRWLGSIKSVCVQCKLDWLRKNIAKQGRVWCSKEEAGGRGRKRKDFDYALILIKFALVKVWLAGCWQCVMDSGYLAIIRDTERIGENKEIGWWCELKDLILESQKIWIISARSHRECNLVISRCTDKQWTH